MNSANEKLWCIHIPGPDDVYAAPSYEMAEHMAACHNADMAEFFKAQPEKLEQWGVTFDEIKARVIEWTHGADEHAEDLADFDPDEWAMKEKPDTSSGAMTPTKKQAFEVGSSYGVLHLDDRRESVTVVARDAASVTLSDGRKARVLAGVAPDGGDEEVIRLNESGAVALGGVVRSSAIDLAITRAAAAMGGE